MKTKKDLESFGRVLGKKDWNKNILN
jgi:hypothetical protein